jgi:2-amino-4-hydroxy-6-hydroxymethyldihydropteridine diphosphokinase
MTAGPAESAGATGNANRFVVMLGSNIDPERNLPAAVHQLLTLGRVVTVSSVWQTAAIGDTTQADFCNAAVLLESTRRPSDLLDQLRAIESRLYRVRDPRNKNAARTIDLDLAVVSGSPMSIAGKQFPDPEIVERVFLAVPLQEIWPDFVFPDGRPIGEVAARLAERDGEKLRLTKRGDIVLPLR